MSDGIASGAVTAAKLADGAVGMNQLADHSVSVAKLRDAGTANGPAVLNDEAKIPSGAIPMDAIAESSELDAKNAATLARSIPRSTIAIIGTLITAQNSPAGGSYNSGTPLWDATGYWSWAQIALGRRLRLIAQKGVGGNTTTQMRARFEADILTLDPLPGYLLIEPGPNDAGGTTLVPSATTIDNLRDMIRRAQSASIRVILATVTPSSFIGATDRRTARGAVNQWIRMQASTEFDGLIIVDWAAALTDLTTGTASATLFKDESGNFVHPKNAGAKRMGELLASSLQTHVSASGGLSTDPQDPGNKLPNPFGSGGSSSSQPTSWQAPLSAAGGAFTGTFGTIASTDLSNPAQWLEVSPTSGGAKSAIRTTTFTVGESLVGEVEIDTLEGFGGYNLTMRVECWKTTAPTAILLQAYGISIRSIDGDLYAPIDGVLRTPAFQPPAGTTRLDLVITFGGTGTVRHRRPAIRSST